MNALNIHCHFTDAQAAVDFIAYLKAENLISSATVQAPQVSQAPGERQFTEKEWDFSPAVQAFKTLHPGKRVKTAEGENRHIAAIRLLRENRHEVSCFDSEWTPAVGARPLSIDGPEVQAPEMPDGLDMDDLV